MKNIKNNFKPYDATLYELLHRGNPGDLEFYQQECGDCESVLELGCGTGRVTQKIAKSAKRVVGIDNHQGMLDLLEQRKDSNVEIVLGDMLDFKLDERFDAVIIPFNGLLCLLTQDDQLNCLKNAKNHLKPQGKLLLDIYHLDELFEDEDDEEDEQLEYLTSVLYEDCEIDIFERGESQMSDQRINAFYLYQINKGDEMEVKEYCIPQRFLLPGQLTDLLQQAGFENVTINGGFEGEPLDEDAQTVVITAAIK